MADRILYSIPEMKQAGANFHAKAEEINDILNYLNSEIENLESVFDGAAQDSLFAKYQELQESLKQFPEILNRNFTTPLFFSYHSCGKKRTKVWYA